MICTKQIDLWNDAIRLLNDVSKATQRQVEALRNTDQKNVVLLDAEIDSLFDKEERAFAALWEHRREHGC